MRHALFLTAYNRALYLDQTLQSWREVRGLKNWHLVFRIEPSGVTPLIVSRIENFVDDMELTDYEIIVNPARLGVLHHPWVGFEALFAQDYDFVVRAEDDLVVSSDILEFFEWAALTYDHSETVAAVVGYTDTEGSSDLVRLETSFSPWVWGTWKHAWAGVIRDTWDHDYSTFNGTPGNQSGWDWNLDTRIFPAKGLTSVYPMASRVDNIGITGVHGTEENFRHSPSFQQQRPRTGYFEDAQILF